MSPEYAKESWIARLWPKRLTLGFGVAVCTAVLITEMIFLIPAAYVWHKSNEREAIEQVRLAWYHTSDPAAFLTPEHKRRIGQRMIADGLVLGGVVYNSAGEVLTVFGERPTLDLNIARLSGINTQPSPNTEALDVHFEQEATNLAHDLILRLPTAPIQQATYNELRNFALSVLFIAGLTALLFIGASMLLVIRPLRAINTALRNAVENPDFADRYQLHMHRQDEIGQISNSLNMLLTSVSVVYQDELASMRRAIESFGFGILQYDHSDRLVAANPHALEQFGQKSFGALRKMNRNFAQPLARKGAKPRPIVDVLGDNSEPMLLTLHTDGGFFTAMAYCASVKRVDGSVMHRFVAVMEMDTLLQESRNALVDGQKAKASMKAAKVEAQEMRRLLESCLCLMEPAANDAENYEYSFLPDRILNGWYAEATSDGLVTGELEHGLLPSLSGNRVAIRKVLRQAMLLAYAYAPSARPVLKVDAVLEGDRVAFSIFDISKDRGARGGPRRKKSVDPTLPQAALLHALGQVGGEYVAAADGASQERATTVMFSLKAAEFGEFEVPSFALPKSA